MPLVSGLWQEHGRFGDLLQERNTQLRHLLAPGRVTQTTTDRDPTRAQVLECKRKREYDDKLNPNRREFRARDERPRIQSFQFKTFPTILDAPWHVSNHTLHNDLNIRQVLYEKFKFFRSKLETYPVPRRTGRVESRTGEVSGQKLIGGEGAFQAPRDPPGTRARRDTEQNIAFSVINQSRGMVGHALLASWKRYVSGADICITHTGGFGSTALLTMPRHNFVRSSTRKASFRGTITQDRAAPDAPQINKLGDWRYYLAILA
ncbi:hypothetical protein AAG570_003343 [Ranatra chinensis]|uniref:Uncharacterized protein n=1 Tax=Ranatra chinensis TaxID=642074 RepID=A0ABD0Y3G3_9HEMI